MTMSQLKPPAWIPMIQMLERLAQSLGLFWIVEGKIPAVNIPIIVLTGVSATMLANLQPWSLPSSSLVQHAEQTLGCQH
jgi:hypothetical protein